jgi:hypothetical protein
MVCTSPICSSLSKESSMEVLYLPHVQGLPVEIETISGRQGNRHQFGNLKIEYSSRKATPAWLMKKSKKLTDRLFILPISGRSCRFCSGEAAAAARYLLYLTLYNSDICSVQGRFSRPNFLLKIYTTYKMVLLRHYLRLWKIIFHESEYWYSEFVRKVLSRYLGPDDHYLLLFQENSINVTFIHQLASKPNMTVVFHACTHVIALVLPLSFINFIWSFGLIGKRYYMYFLWAPFGRSCVDLHGIKKKMYCASICFERKILCRKSKEEKTNRAMVHHTTLYHC